MKKRIADIYDDLYFGFWNFYAEWFKLRSLKRKVKFFFQRRIRGFDDSETWDLDYSFMKWLLPRLKRFQEVSDGIHPGNLTNDAWQKQLTTAIENLTFILEKDEFEDGYIEKREAFFKWFCKNCGGLWW